MANKTGGREGKMILAHGGWACGSRQRELPAAEGMAGVQTWQWAMGATADRARQKGKGCTKEEQTQVIVQSKTGVRTDGEADSERGRKKNCHR